MQKVDARNLYSDEKSRGEPYHPVCPQCGKKTNVMRATNIEWRGSAAGSGALAKQPKYWLCDDSSHGPYGWSTG